MVQKRENIQWAAVVWMNMPCWCQRWMDRLVRDDRKATVTQTTTRYNQGMQNTISEHTTHRTLKRMNYSSRRPHRVPLLSDKNRKQALQSCTIEDWKNVAWSDESRFLLQHSDDRVRIWRKWIHPALSQRQRWKVTNYIYSRYCNWVAFLCTCTFLSNFFNL